MDTIIYCTIQDHCYFRIHTNSIAGYGKSNLASNDVEDIDLPKVFAGFNCCYTLKDSKVLLASINKISHSKEVLILYGCVQGFTIELSAVEVI